MRRGKQGIAAGLLAGAIALGLSTPVAAEAPTALSAFIEGDIKLQPHPELANVYRYIAPGKDLKAFDRVMFEPIEVWLHDDSPYKGVDADELKAFSDRFLEVMIEELEPRYPVVSRPGQGVAVARIAVSGIKLKKKKRGLLGYTPVGFAVTSAMAAAGRRMSLVDATIEGEVLDGVNDERIGVLVDFSFKQGKGNDKATWSDLEARMRLYGKRFREQLDRAHGRESRQYSDAMPTLPQAE